jgi:hypothetical protein
MVDRHALLCKARNDNNRVYVIPLQVRCLGLAPSRRELPSGGDDILRAKAAEESTRNWYGGGSIIRPIINTLWPPESDHRVADTAMQLSDPGWIGERWRFERVSLAI